MFCEYCEKDFYNKSNLLRHQKTAKSCIVIQQTRNKNIVIHPFS